jgi:hypothetical protein
MIDALLCSGLVGFFSPSPPAPVPQFPEWSVVERAPLILKDANRRYDFSGKRLNFGVMPEEVREYGKPSIHIRKTGIQLSNAYWSGSMEGLHVGSEVFSGKGMRRQHTPIVVKLSKLYTQDIGEDGISIQPRAKVTLTDSQFQGNYRRPGRAGRTDNPPGLDKILQIDGAEVTLENCAFFNGFTALRAKANSKVTLRNCVFVDCNTAISGDGIANPRPGQEYDNGKAGVASITLENCTFWNCRTVMHAFKGCEIYYKNCTAYRSWTWVETEDTGKVFRLR